MQIIINVDDALIARLKKSITVKRIAATLMIFVILASAILFGATKPHTFTPGTTISSSQVNESFDAAFDAVAKAVPPGTVMAYAGTTIPEGYLLCDGSMVSRTEYENLYISLGTTYGSGDGLTTFNLPDYRGIFLRGHHFGASSDPDYTTRSLGSIQNERVNALEQVMCDYYWDSQTITIPEDGSWSDKLRTYWSVDGMRFKRKGGETRPVNISVAYIIKY